MARDQDQAFDYFIEYIKIFAMMAVSMVLLMHVRSALLSADIVSPGVLGYIAYEVNVLYLSTGYLGICENGYGGLDNNGAGLMLAMGVPVCILLWDRSGVAGDGFSWPWLR